MFPGESLGHDYFSMLILFERQWKQIENDAASIIQDFLKIPSSQRAYEREKRLNLQLLSAREFSITAGVGLNTIFLFHVAASEYAMIKMQRSQFRVLLQSFNAK